tara:strand:+ start:8293 stop:9108 length:816 start_codon:yes stop_codon:yes gene_type:complete
MSYFGTSGPKSNFAHSIAAGYVRRNNLQNARKTSAFGSLGSEPLKLSTFNTKKAIDNTIATRGVNIRDRANNFYNDKFTKPYGSPAELYDKVSKWKQHEEEVVFAKKKKLEAKQSIVSALIVDLQHLETTHREIKAELDKAAFGRSEEIDTAKVTTLTNEIKQYASGYNIFNYDQTHSELTVAKEAAQDERDIAQREYDNATDVLDNVHMKGVEDWMVRGPLMRESKTALVISPVMIGLGVLGMAYLMKITQTYRPPAASANKGAAFAVFS